MYDKHIIYDRETRDYRMELDGRPIGYARTYHEAEITLDQTVFEMLIHGDFASALELDGDAVEMPQDTPRYTRAAGYDKRISCGDDYAGDCWKDQDGIPRWVAVGANPNEDAPADAPGDDCPDHGPYADEECPKCATCGDDGDCPDCDLHPLTPWELAETGYIKPAQIPLYDDIAQVLDMALGQTHGAASIVSELRRVRARVDYVRH